jgi:CDP-diacylglycerol pyrophosphatase
MILNIKNAFGHFVFSLLLLLTLTEVSAQSNRDILLGIANKCLDTNVENYCKVCSTPRADSICNSEQQCRATVEVWSLNEDFASFRDVKMCGCNSDFVHGLTIPRKKITGVEDPMKPNDIWNFAWKTGAEKIPESELVLVVNPKNNRSQDHLHVHMVRLNPGKVNLMNEYLVGNIQSLDSVWQTAHNFSESKGWNDYGVLVLKSSELSYSVFVTPFNSEHAYTNYRCN